MPVACGGNSTGSPGSGGDSATSGGASAGSTPTPTSGAGGASGGGGVASAGAGTSAGGNGIAGAGGEPVTGGAGGAGGKPGAPAFPCEGSVPVGGDHPGYSRCGETGVWHRPSATECPPSEMVGDGYGCVKDADCGAGKICVCGQPSQCADAQCVTDADCGPGFVCRGYSTSECDGPGVVLPDGFACQTADDVCATFQQCEDGMRCGGDSGVFQCDVMPVNPGCGRPFLVNEAERVAPLCERDDWADASMRLELSAFGRDVRDQAGVAWARIGQMEHASVAAFARFTLQLLQLGAPADLVERASRAAADEVRHARVAFSIAARCSGGSDIGPAALDVERCLEDGSFEGVVRLAVREGCIGETVAALQASEAASVAADAGLRALLADIASDEAEHAELAWRFVSWALTVRPTLRGVLEEELARFLEEAPHIAEPTAGQPELGILSAAAAASIRSVALRDVVEPCLRALLAAETRHELRAVASLLPSS